VLMIGVSLEVKEPGMKAPMPFKRFLQGNEGVIATEYVVFVAAIGIVLVLGVWLLFSSISGYYAAWGNYFSAGN
jgi:Flp pilus assembly pilin Flp